MAYVHTPQPVSCVRMHVPHTPLMRLLVGSSLTLAMLTMERAWWAYLQRHRRAWQAAHREEYCTTPANLQQGVGITTYTCMQG